MLPTGKSYYPIVGVSDDVRGNGFDQPVVQVVYFPMIELPDAPLEGQPRYLEVLVRSKSGKTRALIQAVKRAINELDVQVPVANERSMEQVVARSMVKRTFTLTLLGIASVMALVLSGIGLYGVVSYVVGQRRGEIGIRVALGAQRRGRSDDRYAVRPAGGDQVVVGVVAALATTRTVTAVRGAADDPSTLVVVAVGLVVLAAWRLAPGATRDEGGPCGSAAKSVVFPRGAHTIGWTRPSVLVLGAATLVALALMLPRADFVPWTAGSTPTAFRPRNGLRPCWLRSRAFVACGRPSRGARRWITNGTLVLRRRLAAARGGVCQVLPVDAAGASSRAGRRARAGRGGVHAAAVVPRYGSAAR
jgi:hypothetical protein